MLEGARGHPSYGISVPLKLASVSSYALFPGQIVAVEGTNPTGEAVVAKQVFSDVPLPLPSEPLRLSPADGKFTSYLLQYGLFVAESLDLLTLYLCRIPSSCGCLWSIYSK